MGSDFVPEHGDVSDGRWHRVALAAAGVVSAAGWVSGRRPGRAPGEAKRMVMMDACVYQKIGG